MGGDWGGTGMSRGRLLLGYINVKGKSIFNKRRKMKMLSLKTELLAVQSHGSGGR